MFKLMTLAVFSLSCRLAWLHIGIYIHISRMPTYLSNRNSPDSNVQGLETKSYFLPKLEFVLDFRRKIVERMFRRFDMKIFFNSIWDRMYWTKCEALIEPQLYTHVRVSQQNVHIKPITDKTFTDKTCKKLQSLNYMYISIFIKCIC